MSIESYLGQPPADLRLKESGLGVDRVTGDVLEGLRSVDDAQRQAEMRAQRIGERYGSVAAYDPVLRSHCRLDHEG